MYVVLLTEHIIVLLDMTKLTSAFRDYAEAQKISTFCPHIVIVCCKDLRMKSNDFPIQHELIGLYIRGSVLTAR